MKTLMKTWNNMPSFIIAEYLGSSGHKIVLVIAAED